MRVSQRSGLKKLAFSLGCDFFKTNARLGKSVKEWYFVTDEFNRTIFHSRELKAVKAFLLGIETRNKKAEFRAELKDGIAKRQAFLEKQKEQVKEPSLFDCLEIA